MAKQFTLITGASSGMGAACAKQFSADRDLILASENIEALQEVLSGCSNKDRHLLWHCNFASERERIADSLTKLLVDHEAVINEYVHFAGLTKLSPLKTTSIEAIDTVFNVNVLSIFEIMKALLKKTNQKALNKVVLISALVSRRGNPCNSIYAASKGAVNALTYTMALELAPQVRVNALLPGGIMTPMSVGLNPDYLASVERETPLGWGTPQDVIDYVEFLLSDKAKWITGQTIFVDGGKSAR